MQPKSFQDFWTYLTSFPEGVMGIILLGILLVGIIFYFGEEFFRWLKGSRISHYLSTTPGYEEVYTTHPRYKLRTEGQRMSFYKIKLGSIIEISHGFLRRRSAIYGEAAKNWRVTSDRAWPNTFRWVYLKDRRGLRIEDALPLINTYSSLQAMLDRITELELDLKCANEHRQAWRSAIYTVLAEIDRDRQKYRSQSTQNVREYLEAVTHSCIFAVEPVPTPKEISSWAKLFSKS